MSLKEQRTGAEGSPRSEVAFEDVPIARSLRRSVGSSPERRPIRSRGPSLIVVRCVPVTRRNRRDLGSSDPARRLISRFRIRPRHPIPCVTSTRKRRRTRRSGREVDGSREVGPRSHHTGDRSIRPTLPRSRSPSTPVPTSGGSDTRSGVEPPADRDEWTSSPRRSSFVNDRPDRGRSAPLYGSTLYGHT